MDVCLCAFVYGADYHVYMYMSFSKHMVSQPSKPVLLGPSLGKGTPGRSEYSHCLACSQSCPGTPIWNKIGKEGAMLLPMAGGWLGGLGRIHPDLGP